MKRRDFMKTVGFGAASLAIAVSESGAGGDAAGQVLDGVEARIEKYRKGDLVLRLTGPDGVPLASGTPVEIEQKRHAFLFGCNIFKLNRCRTPDDNAAYEKHFHELLNFATLPFYWWNYERQEGKRDDERTDEIVRWCRDHNVTTKGHPLAWNYVDPRWLADDPEATMKAQIARIGRCVRRFKGAIDIWDVVNEATHYDREHVEKQAPILTAAIRRMGVGNYVREAFTAARQANPDARLLINDYRVDPDYEKKVICELVDKRNTPMYDVIGIQSHMHGGKWTPQKTWEVCDRFAKFGKPLHFTETTLISGAQGWDLQQKRREANFRWVSTAEGEERQARSVAEFYSLLFSHPAIEAITWWDFTDQNAWQGAPAGLLRDDMTPKPAYEELKRLIKGKWWAKVQATVESGGKTSFRGFYGEYDVTARVGRRALSGSFRLGKVADREIAVRLEA